MYKKIYFYKCSDCGKLRQTTKEKKEDNGTCRKCLNARVSEGQTNLFDAIASVNNPVINVNN